MNVDWDALVARTEEEFVRIAIGLAGDLPRLAEIRAGLRGRMERSVLCDGERWARRIEEAFHEMWGTWCEAEMGE
jgi:predicted O-linked N-acetylglucosamine transferase (SPINDLY family)